MLAKLTLLRHKTMMNVAHVYFYALSSINFASKIKKENIKKNYTVHPPHFLIFIPRLRGISKFGNIAL